MAETVGEDGDGGVARDDGAGAGGEPQGYAEMLAELESIVAQLEHEAVDVDRLAALVARAQELVARCRERLETASVEVERMLGDAGPSGTMQG